MLSYVFFNIIMYVIFLVSGLIAGIVISTGIYGLITFTAGKFFGHHVLLFKYLFFRYDKYNGWTLCKFAPICEVSMGSDSDNESAAIALCTVKLVLYGICAAAVLIVSIILQVLLTISVITGGILTGIAVWFVFDTIHRCALFAVMLRDLKNPVLVKKSVEIARQFKEGVPFEAINIPDYESFGFSPMPAEIAQYQHFAFMKEIWMWSTDRCPLLKIIQTTEQALRLDYSSPRPDTYLSAFQANYYDLLFYYCFINANKHRAKYIYEMISTDLIKDSDANGKRVLAYYRFFMEEDIPSAMELVSEGLAIVNDFPIPTQAVLEKRLLTELRNVRDKENLQGIVEEK